VGVFFFKLKNSRNQRTLGFFDFAKHIPKRIGGFHEIT
jgi:hypothetical protein